MIEIDFSKEANPDVKKVENIAKDFGKVEIDTQKLDGDDMLAMMDDNSD